MITVICTTHRPQNQTLRIVEKYHEILEELGEASEVFQMAELPEDFMYNDSFGNRTETFEDVIHRKIVPARGLVIVAPEYNGSYPGIFKAFLDAVKPTVWKGKGIALVGVATGRAGNLRGLDHLTDVMHHLRAEVFSMKVPISRLNELIIEGEDGFEHTETVTVLQKQAKEFLNFLK
ncbi:MAG: hypothetical protein CMI36_11910 [Owenweeksia sp.]|nr:hypothetical protein [Owenweeksia sp.]MBF99687.1 hypothetical protein [Owenweeksia sp.]HBF18797.1 hypothetical protein [Cryomorphaceae bacterium]HCQ16007.1 hypothetical protein [Cryomorphaceae bacterium]|tara:strand:- start:2236 stop:2766 length:531 start_codon:yes stop_codon:yes gene_type:complete